MCVCATVSEVCSHFECEIDLKLETCTCLSFHYEGVRFFLLFRSFSVQTNPPHRRTGRPVSSVELRCWQALASPVCSPTTIRRFVRALLRLSVTVGRFFFLPFHPFPCFPIHLTSQPHFHTTLHFHSHPSSPFLPHISLSLSMCVCVCWSLDWSVSFSIASKRISNKHIDYDMGFPANNTHTHTPKSE